MSDVTLITVETLVQAPMEKVWSCWTEPVHIVHWNNASDDWHTPSASVDLREGGKFVSRMEAKDGSVGFDFSGVFTKVILHERIEYVMEDGRTVAVAFEEQGDATKVVETFAAENEHSAEMQRAGWQSILNNFKQYVESLA